MKTFKFNPCYQRLVNDLKELIEEGFILPDGRKASVRVVQYRMDNLEKAKVMRAKESFATVKEYSSHSYITTHVRKNEKKCLHASNLLLYTWQKYVQ